MTPSTKPTSTHSNREGRPRSRGNSSETSPNVLPLLEHPEFKRLVAQQVDFVCKQAIKAGRIRVVQRKPSPMFVPRMDIVDDPLSPRFVGTFEIPGVRHDEVSLQIRDQSLVIEGQRRPRFLSQTAPADNARDAPSPQTGDGTPVSPQPSTTAEGQRRNVRVPIQELRYGKFRRTITLPPGTKSGDIVARFQEGMLIVTWPRSPASGTDVEMVSQAPTDSSPTPITTPPA